MAIESIITKVSDIDTALETIKDTMVSAGWTLHDDQGSNDYYVLKSLGETGSEMPAYVYVSHSVSANYIHLYLYHYWNSSTHSGICLMSSSSTTNHINISESGGEYLYVSANKDFVACVAWDIDQFNFTHCFIQLGKPIYNGNLPIATLDGAVSSGSSVDLTLLETGAAALFTANDAYQIIDPTNEREICDISAVNTGPNTLTVGTLANDYADASKIGYMPYRWTWRDYYAFPTSEGNGNAAGADVISDVIFYPAFSTLTGCDRIGKTLSIETVGSQQISGSPKGRIFTCGQYIKYFGANYSSPAVPEYANHLLIDNRQYESTSTGSNTSTILNDTGQSWVTGALQNYAVAVVGGRGTGQTRLILSNTATSLTVSAWDITPDSTSIYAIGQKIWRVFNQIMIREL